MTIPLDPRFIPAFSIEDVLLDKDTGAPLSGGQVYFEKDNQRGILKPVYQITGTSPNYTFIQLPNPMTLSSIGTFEDSLGNPVVPYFFPYDSEGNPDYYYIRVLSSGLVPQFDREAVPYLGTTDNADVLSVITNELSNPQFVLVNFNTSTPSYTYNFNAVSNQVVNIAPNWDMIVTAPGVGTLTLSQLAPAGSLNVPTNPSTILTISSTGLTSLILRQRIDGSPNLWGEAFIAATFVAKTYSGTPVTLNMLYSQSNGTVVNQQIVSALLPSSGNYVEFSGATQLIPISNSSDSFPNAYIDIFFDLPTSIKIDLTSVMVAFTGPTNINDINYDQESKARQIDHMYHNAYPVVPVGAIIDFYGFYGAGVPHYLRCDNSAVSRITYQALFSKLTNVETVTLSSGSPSFTVASGLIYAIGLPVEGNGIPAGAKILSISTNTITLTANASITGSSALTFFSVGNGDGSTTFNTPDLEGVVLAGAGPTGNLFSASGVGQMGGTATNTLVAANLPPHSHEYTFPAAVTAGTNVGTSINAGNGTSTPTGNGPGTSTPFSIVQPTALAIKLIRYE